MKNYNFIKDTFLALTQYTYPYGTEDALVKDMIKNKIFPKELKKDKWG